MIKVGVIGCGYWGPNIIRNFMELKEAWITSICDINQERLAFIKTRYPSINITSDYRRLLDDGQIDAVAICTPVTSHYKIAKDALNAGKHVLVEKPLAYSVKECEELIDIAEKNKKILMVDHTFVYTGAVKKMKEVISSGALGEIYYFDSVRINLGLFQHDVNVIWDLAPHDISILDYLLEKEPDTVIATGISHTETCIEDMAYITMKFDQTLIAHFHVNWLAPVKIRQILIGGSEKMLVFDDMQTSEKIKIYDKSVKVKNGDGNNPYKNLVQYRIGDMYAPKIDQAEALRVECEHFITCVKDGAVPLTDGKSGLRVVRIIEAAAKSIKNRAGVVDMSREKDFAEWSLT